MCVYIYIYIYIWRCTHVQMYTCAEVHLCRCTRVKMYTPLQEAGQPKSPRWEGAHLDTQEAQSQSCKHDTPLQAILLTCFLFLSALNRVYLGWRLFSFSSRRNSARISPRTTQREDDFHLGNMSASTFWAAEGTSERLHDLVNLLTTNDTFWAFIGNIPAWSGNIRARSIILSMATGWGGDCGSAGGVLTGGAGSRRCGCLIQHENMYT